MSVTEAIRNDRMLFNYETTYRTDFQKTTLDTSERTKYKPKKKHEEVKKPYVRKDNQTLTDYKMKMPFDMLWTRKEIIRTNPYEKQEAYGKTVDTEREESQRTRPRLVMTPAVSLDDVEDSTARDIVVKDMYTSTWRHDSLAALAGSPVKRISAPLPDLPSPANPIFLPLLKPPMVPREWRRETVEWDGRQLRAHVDPDRTFWKEHDLYKGCVACKETAQVKKFRNLLNAQKI